MTQNYASFAQLVASIEGTAPSVSDNSEDNWDTEADVVLSSDFLDACSHAALRKKAKAKAKMRHTYEYLVSHLELHGYTFNDVKHIWRNSRQDEDAVIILSELVGYCPEDILTLLGLERSKIKPTEGDGIAAFWAGV